MIDAATMYTTIEEEKSKINFYLILVQYIRISNSQNKKRIWQSTIEEKKHRKLNDYLCYFPVEFTLIEFSTSWTIFPSMIILVIVCAGYICFLSSIKIDDGGPIRNKMHYLKT